MKVPWGLVGRAVVYELGLWQSLGRWIVRRPAGRADRAEAFSYAGPVTPILSAFVALSAIEIPVVHFLLPWELVRRVFLALGAYGLFWMIALLASLRVHPHVVNDAGVRVRYGLGVDVVIPWDAIADIHSRRGSRPSGRSGKPQLEETANARILHIPITSQTNVDIELSRSIAVPLARDRREEVDRVRLYVDDPNAFVARARARRSRWQDRSGLHQGHEVLGKV